MRIKNYKKYLTAQLEWSDAVREDQIQCYMFRSQFSIHSPSVTFYEIHLNDLGNGHQKLFQQQKPNSGSEAITSQQWQTALDVFMKHEFMVAAHIRDKAALEAWQDATKDYRLDLHLERQPVKYEPVETTHMAFRPMIDEAQALDWVSAKGLLDAVVYEDDQPRTRSSHIWTTYIETSKTF